MNDDVKQINAFVRIDKRELERMPKDSIEYLVDRTLFRDVAKVMQEEKKNLPIEILSSDDVLTCSKSYKLNFWIIGSKRLKELRVKEEAYDKLITRQKQPRRTARDILR